MHGNLQPHRPSLSCAAYKQYFQAYCGLCQQLRKDYGAMGPWLLSRDSLLLQLLVEAQDEAEPRGRQIRCLANPRPHKARAHPKGAPFAAATTVLLFRARLLDTKADCRGLRGALLRPLLSIALWVLSPLWRKARRSLRSLDFDPETISRLPADQQRAEASLSPSLLACASPTGATTAALFEHTAVLAGRSENRSRVRALGQLYGTALYVDDAQTDLDADRRAGAFNPLLLDDLEQTRARETIQKAKRSIRSLTTTTGWNRRGVLLRHLLTEVFLQERPKSSWLASSAQMLRSSLSSLFRPGPAGCDCDCDCCCGDGCGDGCCGEGGGPSRCCECCDCCHCGDSGTRRSDWQGGVCDGICCAASAPDPGTTGTARKKPGAFAKGTVVYARAADGFWYEGTVTGSTADDVMVLFGDGNKLQVKPHAVTTEVDASPPGYEAVTPGTKAVVVDGGGKVWPGKVVSRFGRIFCVQLDAGNVVWADAGRLRIGGEKPEVVASCPNCGGATEGEQQSCTYCGAKLPTVNG